MLLVGFGLCLYSIVDVSTVNMSIAGDKVWHAMSSYVSGSRWIQVIWPSLGIFISESSILIPECVQDIDVCVMWSKYARRNNFMYNIPHENEVIMQDTWNLRLEPPWILLLVLFILLAQPWSPISCDTLPTQIPLPIAQKAEFQTVIQVSKYQSSHQSRMLRHKTQGHV